MKLGLDIAEITGNPKAVMHYVHHHKEIVERYSVKLVGWTHPTFANPSELSTSLPPLQILLDAIKSGECKFIELTPEQRKEEERLYQDKVRTGEIVLKPRATRKDKGKKRKRTAGGKENAGDSEADNSEVDDNDERVKRRRRSDKLPKSAEIISDEESTGSEEE